jgi:hypothetical protein
MKEERSWPRDIFDLDLNLILFHVFFFSFFLAQLQRPSSLVTPTICTLSQSGNCVAHRMHNAVGASSRFAGLVVGVARGVQVNHVSPVLPVLPVVHVIPRWWLPRLPLTSIKLLTVSLLTFAGEGNGVCLFSFSVVSLWRFVSLAHLAPLIPTLSFHSSSLMPTLQPRTLAVVPELWV